MQVPFSHPVVPINPPQEMWLPTLGALATKYWCCRSVTPLHCETNAAGQIVVSKSSEEPEQGLSIPAKIAITVSVIGAIVLAIVLIFYRFLNNFVWAQERQEKSLQEQQSLNRRALPVVPEPAPPQRLTPPATAPAPAPEPPTPAPILRPPSPERLPTPELPLLQEPPAPLPEPSTPPPALSVTASQVQTVAQRAIASTPPERSQPPLLETPRIPPASPLSVAVPSLPAAEPERKAEVEQKVYLSGERYRFERSELQDPEVEKRVIQYKLPDFGVESLELATSGNYVGYGRYRLPKLVYDHSTQTEQKTKAAEDPAAPVSVPASVVARVSRGESSIDVRSRISLATGDPNNLLGQITLEAVIPPSERYTGGFNYEIILENRRLDGREILPMIQWMQAHVLPKLTDKDTIRLFIKDQEYRFPMEKQYGLEGTYDFRTFLESAFKAIASNGKARIAPATEQDKIANIFLTSDYYSTFGWVFEKMGAAAVRNQQDPKPNIFFILSCFYHGDFVEENVSGKPLNRRTPAIIRPINLFLQQHFDVYRNSKVYTIGFDQPEIINVFQKAAHREHCRAAYYTDSKAVTEIFEDLSRTRPVEGLEIYDCTLEAPKGWNISNRIWLPPGGAVRPSTEKGTQYTHLENLTLCPYSEGTKILFTISRGKECAAPASELTLKMSVFDCTTQTQKNVTLRYDLQALARASTATPHEVQRAARSEAVQVACEEAWFAFDRTGESEEKEKEELQARIERMNLDHDFLSAPRARGRGGRPKPLVGWTEERNRVYKKDKVDMKELYKAKAEQADAVIYRTIAALDPDDIFLAAFLCDLSNEFMQSKQNVFTKLRDVQNRTKFLHIFEGQPSARHIIAAARELNQTGDFRMLTKSLAERELETNFSNDMNKVIFRPSSLGGIAYTYREYDSYKKKYCFKHDVLFFDSKGLIYSDYYPVGDGALAVRKYSNVADMRADVIAKVRKVNR